jgi:hypothetical protein
MDLLGDNNKKMGSTSPAGTALACGTEAGVGEPKTLIGTPTG